MDKERVIKEVDKKIDTLVEQGLTSTATIDALDKLVDMKKDLMEIEKMEKHKYQGEYGEYGNYGRNYMEGEYNEGNYGRRGNYREGYQEGNYGRRMRDSRGRYRGHEMLDEMSEEYGRYEEGRMEYREGNYGAEGQTMKSLEYMLESVVEFIKMLEKEASSQQEVQLIKKYTKKIAEM